MPMHGKAFQCLPALNRAEGAIEVGSNFLPGFEAVRSALLGRIVTRSELPYSCGPVCHSRTLDAVPGRMIFDDQAEKQWEAKLAAGGKKSIGPRPEARLRLVRHR